MTTRISDEQLSARCAETQHAIDACTPWQYETRRVYEERLSALRELQQSRALITQLRELAERMRSNIIQYAGPSHYQQGYEYGVKESLASLDSLLSAHGVAQAEKP